MPTLVIILISAAFGLIVIISLFIFYLVYLAVKLSKLCDKIEFIVDDIIIKLENLNPSLDSLKKLFNYIDAFDLIFKKNLKSGLLLLRRNSFVLFKLLKLFQDLLIQKESKETIFSQIFSRYRKHPTSEKSKTTEQRSRILKKSLVSAQKLRKYQRLLTKVQQNKIKKMDFKAAGRFISSMINKYTGDSSTKTAKKVQLSPKSVKNKKINVIKSKKVVKNNPKKSEKQVAKKKIPNKLS